MLYITCPTCGYFLGPKNLKYEKEKKKIFNDPKYSDEEKEILLTKVLLDLNIKRYCCKMRMMSYKDIIDIIMPINNNQE